MDEFSDTHEVAARAFSFLQIGPHTMKPRAIGLSCIVDGMDSGFLSVADVRNLTDFAAPYIDYVKLGWTIPMLASEERLREKVGAPITRRVYTCSAGGWRWSSPPCRGARRSSSRRPPAMGSTRSRSPAAWRTFRLERSSRWRGR
ncbi:MAG: hypothetical protein GEU78_07730 [Actinobacteria bacterium]|nr:hypothetical protein [Actinomycetota bacterium]MQB00168.1 hypothetical protein [Actinomycetota bacterium]